MLYYVSSNFLTSIIPPYIDEWLVVFITADYTHKAYKSEGVSSVGGGSFKNKKSLFNQRYPSFDEGKEKIQMIRLAGAIGLELSYSNVPFLRTEPLGHFEPLRYWRTFIYVYRSLLNEESIVIDIFLSFDFSRIYMDIGYSVFDGQFNSN